MSWGDILKKIALGEVVTAGEAETLRLVGNALENLIGLASKVDPITGAISDLKAGPVTIDNRGISMPNNITGTLAFEDSSKSLDNIYIVSNLSDYLAFVNKTKVGGHIFYITLDNDSTPSMQYYEVSSNKARLAVTGSIWCNDGVSVEGTVFIKQQAAAASFIADWGQLWVNDATPCELWFTDNAGTDIKFTTEYSIYHAGATLSASGTIAAVGYRSRAGKSALSASSTVVAAGEVV